MTLAKYKKPQVHQTLYNKWRCFHLGRLQQSIFDGVLSVIHFNQFGALGHANT